VQIAVVGDGQGGLVQLLGAANEVVYPVGSIEEGVLRVTVEMDEGHPKQNTARSVVRQRAASLARRFRAFRAAHGARVKKWSLIVGGSLAFVLTLFLTLTETGRYLARAGWEEAKILARRRDIDDIVADSTVGPVTRAKLRTVLDARAFARDSLGLDVGKSFTTFSQLKRDTLVLVLSAAYRDRLAYHRWWFPIVGHVPYKGYFNYDAARADERDFQQRGFDTYLRPAAAFSTLGWFNDPLVSTTLRSDTLSLANTVVHELLHNTFYASGQAEFNESFANFVGARGSADFFRSRGQPGAVEEADARWSDEKLLARFWKQLHGDIDSVFRAHPGDANVPTRLALRDSVYRAARNDLVFRLGPQLRTVSPHYVQRVRLDNAALLARRIYLTDLDLFDSVWVREGRDTRRTIERVIEVADDEKQPFDALRRWLAAPK
jgi:predicted aminopeptidase